jgi:hypothetical protein
MKVDQICREVRQPFKVVVSNTRSLGVRGLMARVSDIDQISSGPRRNVLA